MHLVQLGIVPHMDLAELANQYETNIFLWKLPLPRPKQLLGQCYYAHTHTQIHTPTPTPLNSTLNLAA